MRWQTGRNREQLGRDRLDLVLLHNPERAHPGDRPALCRAIRDAFAVLEEAVAAGHVTGYGALRAEREHASCGRRPGSPIRRRSGGSPRLPAVAPGTAPSQPYAGVDQQLGYLRPVRCRGPLARTARARRPNTWPVPGCGWIFAPGTRARPDSATRPCAVSRARTGPVKRRCSGATLLPSRGSAR
ncbi:aldo/keto reductase [Streptomyces sp. ID05-04B]|uniref:aldo/keto reductase n=1 Tax=unclassified Streptomyces TaxID=2593676 RepID=UPI0020B144B1|nr:MULTISPECIES: aldo/keto reductase [unclassified Streptomyces]MDX5564253.1 aldo/keto reductase [Streptomyces sp. ID05-04B]